jgi:D-glycero-D-manno-heptose 1,7-bisphosphate phosphatase
MKIAFFDRDGTINYEYLDDEWRYVTQPVLMPNAIEAMRHVLKLGYQIIIITYQYLIGEGAITHKQYLDFNELLFKELSNRGVNILDIFYCPHARNEQCSCSKPKTGLIEQAISKYPGIDLTKSFIIGDSLCDIQLAGNLNMPSYGIRVKADIPGNTVIDDIIDLKALLKD